MASILMLLANPYRPDPRVMIEARALAGAGHRVRILAWGRDTGEAERFVEDGIEVVRVGPVCPFRSIGRMMTGLPRYWTAALKASKEMEFDVIHSHDLDTLPLGLFMARLAGRPMVYDGHELYSAMVKDDVGPLYWPLSVLERFLVKRADTVVTVSESLSEILSRGRKDKARIVRTSPDVSLVLEDERARIREENGVSGFVIGYLGSLEPGRFVEELLAAFQPSDGVTVLMAGSGSLKGKVEEAASRQDHIIYMGTVSAEKALKLTAACDIVVAMMDPGNPNNVIGTPGKILNSMALGRPVVTNEGLQIADIVRRARSGLVVPFEIDGFRAQVLEHRGKSEMLREMGDRGRAYFDEHLSWSKSREELLAAYRLMLGADQ